MPDLKPCLYWNPSLGAESEIPTRFSFYTSDDIGKYVIQVSGISVDGTVFTTEKTFQVLPNKD